MSRPGYPQSMEQVSTVHNSYDTWDNHHFDGTDSCLIRKRFEDKSGDNTPGWPSAIRTNSYLRSVFTWEQSALSVDGQIDQGSGHFDHSSGEFGNGYGVSYYPWSDSRWVTSDFDTIVRNRIISALIDNIQSHRVNLGEIYATRSQAATTVASTLNRLAGAAQALHKGNFAGAARYLTGSDPRTRFGTRKSRSGNTTTAVGGIPEQWLALKYGWLPLLKDVYNSCETVRKAWHDSGEAFTAVARASETPDKVDFTRDRAVPWGPRFRITSSSRSVRGYGTVTYGVESNIGSSLSQLGVTNPASVAWELIPYSFVVDWFLPIGPFLERLDYSRGLYFKYGSISIKRYQEARQDLVDSSVTSGNISSTFSGARGSGSAMVFTREALTSFPSPPPPSIKDPFSLTHVANGLSLLASAFGRKAARG